MEITGKTPAKPEAAVNVKVTVVAVRVVAPTCFEKQP
jgi:hypothetical protein